MKGLCLEILLKWSLVFRNFAKSCEKLMFGDFLEIISGRSLMSYVKSRERLVFGYFSLFCWKRKSCEKLVFGDFVENRWFFTALRSLVKRSCLEISWMISGLSSYVNNVKSRERLVFGDFIEMISGLSKLCKVVWNARVWRFSWNVLLSFAAM